MLSRISGCFALVWLAVGCGSSNRPDQPRSVHHEYDVLTGPIARPPHDDVMPVLHGPDPTLVDAARGALASDSRDELRVHALQVLDAELSWNGIPDYIAALDDPAIAVWSSAAAALVKWAPGYMDRATSQPALAALRAHAPALRAALASSDADVRERVAQALLVIADPQVELAVLLADASPGIRQVGLALARTRTLTAADMTRLIAVGRDDPHPNTRLAAVNLVVETAEPAIAVRVALDATTRDDVDLGTALAIQERHLVGAVPALLAYLRSGRTGTAMTDRGRWLEVTVSFKLPCTARTIAALLAEPNYRPVAADALQALATAAGISTDPVIWAAAQPDDVPPCAPAH